MTQEDKQLLLKDLCARLPYGITCRCRDTEYSTWWNTDHHIYGIIGGMYDIADDILEPEQIKPYLRPMSSMTEEEKEEYRDECKKVLSMPFKVGGPYPITDWLNLHHFDHRGLISMGLALEAPEGIYKIE